MAANSSVGVGSCCLCRQTFTADKRKKRKLHHSSATRLKQQLQNISRVPLESLIETAQEDAYLCNKCESSIKSIETWEDKVAKLKMDIMDTISKLHPVIGLPVETLRKRQLHEIDVGEPPEKCQHITSESGTPLHVSNVGMQLPSMQSPSPVVPSLTTTTAETVASSSTPSSPDGQVF